jgi:uncharacterized RDD family membrane protein YckC
MATTQAVPPPAAAADAGTGTLAGATGTPPPPEVRYVGLVTRIVAMVIDAAIISFVGIVASLGVGLILALLHTPRKYDVLVASLGGAASILWAIGYHVAFWSATGQTPGDRVMQIRVVTASGARLKPARALLRCAGLVLAAIPLFAGYLPILYDRRRRGLADYMAQTLVVEAPQLSVAGMLAARRGRKGAAQLPPADPA